MWSFISRLYIEPRSAFTNVLLCELSPQTTLETKLTESRDVNQLLGKLLRDTQNEKRMLEHRHSEQEQKLKETTGLLERQDAFQFVFLTGKSLEDGTHDNLHFMTNREILLKKELEELVSSLQAQVVSLEARNSSVHSPRRLSPSRSPQSDRKGPVSPQRVMQGIDWHCMMIVFM